MRELVRTTAKTTALRLGRLSSLAPSPALPVALTLVAAGAGALLIGPSARGQEPSEAATEPPPVADQTAESPEEASRLARELDRRVEITSEREESATVFANPDGSRSARLFSAPVRVREGGSWRAIDPKLEAKPDALEPAAGVGDLSLSNGGKGTVARLAQGGKAISLETERSLPKPQVAGRTARYRDAFGGADLELEALPDGFSERIVLDERPSEASVYRFDLRTDGLRADVASDERLRLRDSDGKVFALSTPARMWGAEKDPDTDAPKRSAPLDIEVRDSADGQVLEIRPDQGFLADPKVKLPITIDPTVRLGTNQDTFAYSASPNDNTGQGSGDHLRVGWHGSGFGKTRSFVRFTTDSIAPAKHVLSAWMHLYQHDAYSCTASYFQAHRTTEYWHNSGITWNTQPTVSPSIQGSLATSKGGGSSCPGGYVSMALNAGLVQGWVAGSLPNYGLMLKASEDTETGPNTLKTFASANHPVARPPYLDVAYNSYPAVPAFRSPGSTTAPGPELSDATPTLSARFDDEDGGDGKVDFQVFDAATGALAATGSGATVASGQQSTWTPPNPLPDHKRYYWRAIADDGTDYSRSWSSNLFFSVEENAYPATPTSLSPPNGASLDTLTPTLKADFSDREGGQGQADFVVYDDATGELVTAGRGSTVASGSQSAWQVPATKPDGTPLLQDDRRYRWIARGYDGQDQNPNWTAEQRFTTDAPVASEDAGILPHWQFEEEGLTDRLSLGTNVGNGNLVASAKELKLAGTGLDLELDRHYNSKASARPGAFGPGWTLSTGQDVKLERRSDGSVRFFGPSGYAVKFTEPSTSNGETTYKTPRGVKADLERKSDSSYELKLDQSREKYVFNADGRLERQEDKNDHRINFGYDQSGRLTRVEDTQHRFVALTYDAAGLLTRIEDQSDPDNPRRFDYAYESGRLQSSTDPTGAEVGYEYDAGGRLSAIVDAEGTRTELASDPEGRVSEIRRAPDQSEASVTRYAWDPTTSACDGTEDSDGNPEETDDRQSTDPNGQRTTYCADEHDQVLRVEDAAGHRQDRDYDAQGNVSTATNATQDASRSEFQGRDLKKKTSAAGAVTEFSYDASSGHLPASISDPSGNTTAYKYDSAGNMQSTSAYKGDPNDPNSNPEQETEINLDYNGRDDDDRTCETQTTDTGPKGTLRCSEDGEGRETVYRYDAKGNLTEEDPPGDGPEAGGQAQGKTRYEYDAHSRVVAVTDPNRKRREITYDALDRTTSVVFEADDSEVRYDYDENGNKTRREEGKPGLLGGLDRTTEYDYDRLNRLVEERFPDGKVNGYRHDAADNLLELRDETGTTRYDYNAVNLVTQLTEPCSAPAGLCAPGEVGPQTQFAYDDNNNRKRTTFPNGVVQATRFDKDERAQEIKGFARGQLSDGQDPSPTERRRPRSRASPTTTRTTRSTR